MVTTQSRVCPEILDIIFQVVVSLVILQPTNHKLVLVIVGLLALVLIEPRALAETGLVAWRVLVDPPYFEHLQVQFSGHVQWVAADTFTATDPFRSTLIIKKN